MPEGQGGGSAYHVLPDGVVVAVDSGTVIEVNPAAGFLQPRPGAELGLGPGRVEVDPGRQGSP